VIEFGSINDVDASALRMLQDLHKELRERRVRLLFSSCKVSASERLGSPLLTKPLMTKPRSASERLGSPLLTKPLMTKPRSASERLGSPRMTKPLMTKPRSASERLGSPLLTASDCFGSPCMPRIPSADLC
jgi:hypothetical protein